MFSMAEKALSIFTFLRVNAIEMNSEELTYNRLLTKIAGLRNYSIFQDSSEDNIFKQLIENIDEVFWVWAEEEMIYVNPAFEKIWGIPCSELYKNPEIFADFIHPDDREKVLEILKSGNFIQTGYEYRIIPPDNQVRWIFAKSIAVLNALGKVVRHVGVARDISQQKKSQVETSLLAEMLDIAPNSITIHDHRGRFLYANQKTFEIHGYTPDEFMQINLHDLDVPESAALIHQRMIGIHEKGQANFTVEHLRKDGSKIPLEVFVKLVDWKGARAMLSIATDISERKEIESRNQLLTTIIENSQDFIGLATPDQHAFYVNPAGRKMVGLESEEIAKRTNIEEYFFEEDIPFFTGSIIPQLKSEGRWVGEFRFRHFKTKEPIEVYYDLFLTENPDTKQIINISTITRNISLQKSIEKELAKERERTKASEAFYRQTFEKSPLGIAHVNAEGEFLKVNEPFCEIVGYTKDEILAMNFISITYPEDLKREEVFIQKVLANEINSFSIEKRYIHKNGHLIWISLHSNAIRGEDNRVLFAIISIVDITDRIKLQTELIKAKEKAEESDRLKTAFLHNMSHEIRTPMNAIMGFAELLPRNIHNKEKLENYVSIINQRCSDLLVIIDDILDIARIESGQLQINSEQVNIVALLKEVELIFSQQKLKLNKPLLEIGLQIPPGLSELYIISDKSRLMQIFNNLLSNALKFTLKGKVEFGFSLLTNNALEFYVSDTGIGIPKDKQDVIFDRFIQVSQNTGQFMGGNGLGLSITKGLVQLLGGEIRVASETGLGSTFYFTITTDSIGYNITEEAKGEYVVNSDLSFGKTVLIVEDDDNNVALVKEILEDLHLNLLVAKSGLDAIEICSNRYVDLVLMDIGLPYLSGYETTKLILAHSPGIKIIAQTAYASEPDKIKAMESGCIDYISKPIKISTLIDAIKKHL